MESGIKDTIQEHFFDKLFSSYKTTSGNVRKQEALDAAVERLPPDIKSAVWRLHGMFAFSIPLLHNLTSHLLNIRKTQIYLIAL